MKQENRLIQRYSASERINHWIVAFSFIVLALSGLALFYPSFSWFGQVFGTLQTARIVHPFVGIIMFVGFMIQFVRYAPHNIPNMEDVRWALSVKKVIMGEEVGDVGKYNAGQKGMFWAMTGCLFVMLVTGIMMWQSPFFFADHFSIELRRIAILLHAWAALILIACIIVHVYAAIWIRGTIRAMTEGVVSEKWAHSHHPAWYREIMKNEKIVEDSEKKESK
ncbi:formate dehydrogenase subunit gamma [Wohlfahrtiimonas sp. G9077]|uniref:formate dehydrogenase subunit gamma n=1 Tax=Wohlfahrtiimonas sp. G9077 TaxID=1980118 RepID=UPI000B9975A7|nr:formate dehydrogenase subunit gamma [Wohlfahrtiimonas sp. G9077]OYQ75272.1 formate dehydrogenase subunit gamma [Wohlfahrtiimonas sp. G9077]